MKKATNLPLLVGCYLGTRFTLLFDCTEELATELRFYLLPYFNERQAFFSNWEIVVTEKAIPLTAGIENIQTDYCGSLVGIHDNLQTRWYVRDKSVDTFLAAQDIYCGIRRIAGRFLPGGILLHAACLNINGKTVALIGDKGSGKSTFSYACMLALAADYISGDKLCLWTDGGYLNCAGLIDGIRFNHADKFLFENNAAHLYLMTMVTEYYQRGHRIVCGKVCLSPHIVCKVLNRQHIAESQLDALILLQSPQHEVDFYPVEISSYREQIIRHVQEDRSAIENGLMNTEAAKLELFRALDESYHVAVLEGRPSYNWVRDCFPSLLTEFLNG